MRIAWAIFSVIAFAVMTGRAVCVTVTYCSYIDNFDRIIIGVIIVISLLSTFFDLLFEQIEKIRKEIVS